MARGDAEKAADLIVSAAGMVALFRITQVTLSRWVGDGMPKHSHGKYRLADCIQWRRQRDMEAGKGGDGDLAEEKRRLIVEQRRGHELENAARAEELLPADEVMTDMLAYAAVVASQLDALPQRLSPRLVGLSDPAVVRRTLRDECRAVRTAASEAWSAYGHSLGDGEDHRAAARPRRRAVGRRSPEPADRQPGAGAVED